MARSMRRGRHGEKEVDISDVEGCHNKKLHNITKSSGRGGAHVHGERLLGCAVFEKSRSEMTRTERSSVRSTLGNK